jgi:hypothetical protein
VFVAGFIVANPFMASRVKAWRQEGWSGVDAAEIRVSDYLASRVRADGRNDAIIGYRGGGFGREIDFIIEHRHGITNRSRCLGQPYLTGRGSNVQLTCGVHLE